MNRASTASLIAQDNGWRGLVRRLASVVPRLHLPGQCLLCCQAAPLALDLCDHCLSLWPRPVDPAGRMCLGCGAMEHMSAPCAPATALQCCSMCQHHDWPWRHVVAPFRFDWPVDQLMRRYKVGSEPVAGRVFGALLGRAVWESGLYHGEADGIDPRLAPETLTRYMPHAGAQDDSLWVLPMPIHPGRLRQRGFNQARTLALWCLRELNRLQRLSTVDGAGRIPLAPLLSSSGQTPMAPLAQSMSLRPQALWRHEASGGVTGLSRGGRALQIMGAFGASDSVSGRRVAIVDDVLTTGASAGELARELLDQGARSVDLWVVARTPGRSHTSD